MNRHTLQAGEWPIPIDSKNLSIERHISAFSHICERLIESITRRNYVDERMIRDFSKQVIWIITNDVSEVPKTFSDLADILSDYWHYGLEEESDTETEYSYLRLYQLACIIQIQQEERAKISKALVALDENKPNANLLRVIQTVPGITFRQLRKESSISSEKLRECIEKLIHDGFISSRREGEGQFYFLTHDGETLYHIMATSNENDERRFKPWSLERIYVLYGLLETVLVKNINDVPMIPLLQRVSEFNADKIMFLAKLINSSAEARTTNHSKKIHDNVNFKLNSYNLPKYESVRSPALPEITNFYAKTSFQQISNRIPLHLQLNETNELYNSSLIRKRG